MLNASFLTREGNSDSDVLRARGQWLREQFSDPLWASNERLKMTSELFLIYERYIRIKEIYELNDLKSPLSSVGHLVEHYKNQRSKLRRFLDSR